MGFPDVDWQKIQANLKRAFDAQGTATQFRLHPEGNIITVKATRGYRRSEAITDGLLQAGFKVRILASEWDPIAPRAPRQGDRIRMLGREHAIEEVHELAVGAEWLMYVMIMKG